MNNLQPFRDPVPTELAVPPDPAARSASKPVRVLSVDDNEVLGQALLRWGRTHGVIEMVAHVETGALAMELVPTARPDVVLLDLEIPGTDTLALIPRLVDMGPVVLMLSGRTHPAEIMATMDAGAGGYVSKDNDLEYIANAAVRACRGELVLCAVAAAALGFNQGRRGPDEPPSSTQHG